MNIIKILVGTAASALVFGSIAVSAFAANPRPHRPNVIGATPDLYNANWVTGTSQDGGAKSQSIKLGDHSTDAADFAYYSFRNWWNQKLTDVTKVRASFLADPTAVNLGGSPRISLEVEDVVDGPSTGVIYLDPFWCGDPAPTGGGWVEADFTGDRTNCAIYTSLRPEPFVSDEVQSAWNKLVSDPLFAGKRVYFAYAIQDATVGINYIDRIMLDSAFFTKQP